jgi:glucosyl-dolichyl phosphate glucuronosyltransferase
MQALKANANKSTEATGFPSSARQLLITVAICTRNRAALLEKAVRSVLAQPGDDMEILIVNNGSTDNTPALATRFAAADLRVKIVHEPQIGLSIARNCALRKAKGDWVVFLDDDVTVEPGWLAAYRKFLSVPPNTRVVVAGSTVIPQYEILSQKWRGGRGKLELGPNPFCFARGGNPSECNCAYHRNVTLQVGGFDARLGHRGDAPGSHEGPDLNLRLQDAGYEIWWLPGAPVRHLVHAGRLNWKWFLQMAFNQGRCTAIKRLKSHPGSTRGFYIAGRVLIAPLHCGVNLLVMLATFPFQNGRMAMGALAHAVSIAGLMFELVRQSLKNDRGHADYLRSNRSSNFL